MTLVAIAALVLVVAAGGLGLAAALTTFQIVESINVKVPHGDRVEPIGWYPTKTLRVIRQYRELYPQGGMVRRLGIYTSLGFASILAAGTAIGFSPLLIALLAAGAAILVWFTFRRR